MKHDLPVPLPIFPKFLFRVILGVFVYQLLEEDLHRLPPVERQETAQIITPYPLLVDPAWKNYILIPVNGLSHFLSHPFMMRTAH